MAKADTRRLLSDILSGAHTPWGRGGDAATIAEVLEAGRAHGVLPLLDAALRRHGHRERWPVEIVAACREAARAEAMLELARRAEIVRVLDALAAAGVAPLLLKGGALAYSHYESAALRPRADTDLLVAPGTRREAELALVRLGYAKGAGVEGEYVSQQTAWSRSDALGATHHLDIHWRVNNSPMLARVLDHAELAARATPLPALGSSARAPAPVHALLLACIHRAGHAHAPYVVDGLACDGGDRLVWLYDVHLLVGRMSAGDLAEFAALAAARGVRAICAEALRRSRECFATGIPATIVEALERPGPVEATTRYLSGGRGRRMLGDFLALERWNERCGWVRELALPSAGYMRQRYSDTPGRWLPILYTRRALGGIARLILPRDAGS